MLQRNKLGPVLTSCKGKGVISFIIANYNGQRFLVNAVASALAQRDVDVEVIIVDDCSTDDSAQVAMALAQSDSRVRFIALSSNSGPAGARNAGLAEARGEWIAVLDNDDLIHPGRSAALIEEANACGADIIADNLVLFDDEAATPPSSFLKGKRLDGPQWISLASYLEQTVMHGSAPNLGFLKPMWRREWLIDNHLKYDANLRIAEDDDLIVRALLAGARYRLMPQPWYFYRKHGASISHRLSPANADKMVEAIDRVGPDFASQSGAVRRAWDKRSRSIRAACAFTHMIDAIKAKRLGHFCKAAIGTPGALLLFRQPIMSKLQRLIPKLPRGEGCKLGETDVVFISRQRLIGATNGSSAYLLALAQAVRDAGLTPHLVQPSPSLFGRTPFIKLRPEMDVFASIRIRQSLQIEAWRITYSPGVWLRALHGAASRLAQKAGLASGWLAERKAPYAIATPWTLADRLYIAQFARGSRPLRAVLLDYFFQAEAIPYVMDPAVQSAIIMHDRFSARDEQFAAAGQKDSVAAIDQATEIAGLMQADAVIAIQKDEADFVRAHVPHTKPVLAPMSARIVKAPQPGAASEVLFVGSNTAPNVHGLHWFIEFVWPAVHAACPDAVLIVAGKVADAITVHRPGVRILGLVDDLAPLYANAGVVVSPLLQGSGLKIKLVEALAHGKAAVVTSVTLQGVADLLKGAVLLADEPEPFAQAVISLLQDDKARAELAVKAWDAASQNFGPKTAFAEFSQWLKPTCSDRDP
ncbi:glycosyltransferase [Novosphingobium sp.]|uniref:glycosyltransferase n=1 Tax=Novosphingobium sp. TaxID=1874826 RepID=UPI0035612DAC